MAKSKACEWKWWTDCYVSACVSLAVDAVHAVGEQCYRLGRTPVRAARVTAAIGELRDGENVAAAVRAAEAHIDAHEARSGSTRSAWKNVARLLGREDVRDLAEANEPDTAA
jgi:hypothetical protein